MKKSIREVIDKIFNEVSNSKLGPLIYSIKDGKVVREEIGLQAGADSEKKLNVNPLSMDAFKICLMAELGLNVNDRTKGDEWKNDL